MGVQAASASSDLTLLLVEDDPFSREMVLMCISGLFKAVVVAVDGDDGLNRYRECAPDLILTDQVLPGRSGLEMVQEIRAADPEIPVVLMTSSMDNEVLVEAINVGVSKFVPKPIDFRVFNSTLKKLAEEMESRRLLGRHLQQEMELLRYKDHYNSLQQEAARRKERHVVRNDLRHRAVCDRDGNRWVVEAAYAPRDIMSGDAYTVRQLPDGRLLIFLVDAMGSGLFASLSAVLAVSFSNYLVEHLHCRCGFNIANFIDRFKSFIPGMLLEDEVLSCGFMVADLARQEAEAALFALPPLLVRGLDGTVREIRSANPPFCTYTGEVSLTGISLKDVAEVLLMTDGVTDADLLCGGPYREVIAEDLRACPTLAALERRFRSRIDAADQDDLTLLSLRRLDLPPAWSLRLDPLPRLDALGEAIGTALERLDAELALDADERDEVEVILTEAMTNALEHGCLGIGQDQKRRLILEGRYEEAVATASAPPGSEIALQISLWRGAQQPLLTLEVAHSGETIPAGCLDAAANATAVSGRGLLMISRLSDNVFIGPQGTSLIILKSLKEGTPWTSNAPAALS